MGKNKYKNVMEATEALESSVRSIDTLHDLTEGKIFNTDVAKAMGVSFADHLYDACEALLYLLCDSLATPDGTVPYLGVKDLFKEGNIIGAPAGVRCAANAVEGIRKDYHRNGISLDGLMVFIAAASNLIDWICSKLDLNDEHVCVIKELKGIIEKALNTDQDVMKSDISDYSLRMLVFRNKNVNELSEEEADRIYRIKATNTNKSLLPLYVYKILKENSGENNTMTQAAILKELRNTYEVKIGRDTLARHLHMLVDSMMGINQYGDGEGGYFYSKELEEKAYGKDF